MRARTDQEDRCAEFAHRQHKDVDPTCQQHRREKRQQDAREGLGEPGARDGSHLLELAMDLGDPARCKSHPVGKIQRHICNQQDPNRVVDRNRQHEIGDEDSGTDDHPRYCDRRKRERIEDERVARQRPLRDPCHDEGETGDDGRGHRRKQHARFHRREKYRIAQDELVILERRPRRCGDERLRQITEEGLPEERNERQAEREDEHRADPERHRPAGAPELDAGRPVAFTGHRGERFRVLGGATIEEYCEHANREQREAKRACHSERRRRGNDGALDVGGEHVDARRPADEAGDLVGGHAHHEQQQQRGKDRRPQQRKRNLGEDLAVACARHQRGLLHAQVERAQRRPQHQIGERKIVARQRPGHPRHRIDVHGRLGEPERRLEQRVGPADVRAEDENPGHRH